jgi:hypothetical protein
MGATSLGGSFNSLASNNNSIKKSLGSTMIRGAIITQFPYLRYLPFWPQIFSADMEKRIDQVLNRREKTGEVAKKDLVQIILSEHQEDPIGFPEERVRDEIFMFMCVDPLLVEHTVS